VLGHEAAGVIESARGAAPGWPSTGDHLRRVPPCRDGYRNLCARIRFAGHGDQDGAMREFLAWPSDLLHPLPDSVTDTDGALLEPLGVAIHALDLGHVRLGARVAVVGCGPIGLLLIAVLRTAGARHIAAFEPLPHRGEAALRYGADVCLRPISSRGPARTRRGRGRCPRWPGPPTRSRCPWRRPAPAGGCSADPADDQISFRRRAQARATIAMARRMNDVYGRAIGLVEAGSWPGPARHREVRAGQRWWRSVVPPAALNSVIQPAA
jgi:L-iditol 2-dehydrogenase